MLTVATERLTLVAATLDLARAELRDRGRLAALLDAEVPDSWPPPLNDANSMRWTIEFLETHPDGVGWGPWYFLARIPDRPRALVGIGGFTGMPRADGTVEIGYSMLEAHQRSGYATEAVHGLVRWAFGRPGVHRVVGQTLPELAPSIRVLEKCGFRFVGPGTEDGAILYERARPTTPAVERREPA
jgi:ribosomal-protein-alanine N-acetyltransferase